MNNHTTIRETLEKEYRVDDLKPLAKMLCNIVPTKQGAMITCHDPETAVRVLAAAKPDGERVTDTIVAFSDLKGQAALIRKLSAIGIFLGMSAAGEKKSKEFSPFS